MKTENSVPAKDDAARLFPDDWLLKFAGSYERIHAVATKYLEMANTEEKPLKASQHIEAAMLGKYFVEQEGLPVMAGFPNFKVGGVPPQAREYIIAMHEWLRDYAAVRLERAAAEKAESLEEHFAALLDKSLGYELTEHQLIQLRRHVTELQERFSNANGLPAPCRERVLQRLETLQLELQPKLSSLDRVYGTTMEVLVVAQLLADKSKAVLDVAGKIFSLIWALHSRKDGRGLSQTIVPLPLPPRGDLEVPLSIPLPFAATYSKAVERRG